MSDITTSPCQAPVAAPDPAPKTAAGAATPASPASADVQRVKAVAAQFESILISQMLTQMRKSVFDDGDDKKSGTEPLADQMYSELGLALSRAGGFGLADSLTGSLLQRAGLSAAGTAGAEGALGSLGLLQNGTTGLPLTLPNGIQMPAALQGIPLPTGLSSGIPLGRSYGQPSQLSMMPSLSLPMPTATGVDPSALMSQAVATAVAAAGAAAPAPDASGSPAVSGPVSSPYGWRKDPIDGQTKFHSGTDLPMPIGSDVHAASDGRVTFVGERSGYGLTVEVTHANGLMTRYAHLSSSAVQPGDVVSAGQVIAASGNSGRSTGPHLHFEVMENGQSIDPQGAGAAKLAELRR